jgi:hypothetical protein
MRASGELADEPLFEGIAEVLGTLADDGWVLGVAGALLGLILIARAHDLGPKILGTAIVLSAMALIAIVPRSLAHRWRSPDA